MAGLQHDTDALAALSQVENEKRFSTEKHSQSDIVDNDPDHELDGIHDGLEFPTEEEKLTLRRVPDSIPWAAYCECGSPFEAEDSTQPFYLVIALVEFAERFSVRLPYYPFCDIIT